MLILGYILIEFYLLFSLSLILLYLNSHFVAAHCADLHAEPNQRQWAYILAVDTALKVIYLQNEEFYKAGTVSTI